MTSQHSFKNSNLTLSQSLYQPWSKSTLSLKLHNINYSIQKLRWNASIVRDLNPLFLTIVMPPTDIGMSLTNPILSDLAPRQAQWIKTKGDQGALSLFFIYYPPFIIISHLLSPLVSLMSSNIPMPRCMRDDTLLFIFIVFQAKRPFETCGL